MSRTKEIIESKKEEVCGHISTANEPETKKEESKALIKKFMEEESKTVKGVFRNLETPGGSLRVQIKKYKELPMYDKILFDGETYEVPLYVARHLNGTDVTAKHVGGKIHTCQYPIHGFKWQDGSPAQSAIDGQGVPVPIIQPAKWTRRYAFESLEFNASV